MHEISIVRNIISNLEEQYQDRLQEISKVKIEAGLLCNVQPILIQNAFEALILEDIRLENIDLEVVLLPVIANCKKCEKDFEVKLHKFVCSCGEPSRDIIQGEELRISQVDFFKSN
ncbi:Hydrogenase maturation factor HypA [Candidatus Ornithobacterium hominis]|uniref:hydrogenase maturation nickel metallochaperone HypA/HybF n=1 Tax=Candidatus Ornithobacterium hominis TaxID=2497989 RepID=UPI0024BD38B7|nr:hydrogenase maturation nickel metallochaperone HypA [Candidatus Ornithobacterium hominis]CAI9429758.1 Hydrogenase maturation factor HypA [Candidatus Ornithobacterium hominis]